MTAWRLQLLCSPLVIIFVILNSSTCYVARDERISITGNVTLGALFAINFLDVNGSCSPPNSFGAIQEIEAMLYAVDKINADDKLLPNIKLGVKAFDTCGDRTSALNSAVKDFVLGNKWDSTDQCREPERPVIGVVGPAYSNEAVHITPFMNLFEIPVVSFSATSAKLSNKAEYEYFSRTVTSDYFQILAIIDLLVYFNWTYVSILYSDEAYGIAGYEGLKEKAEENGIHFANKKRSVPQKVDKETYQKIVEDILSIPEATVIILFGVHTAMEPILHMIQERVDDKLLLFVGSDSISSVINEDQNKLQQIKQQALFINPPSLKRGSKFTQEFTDHFLNLSIHGNERNPWFKNLFVKVMNCDFESKAYKGSEKHVCNPNQTLASANFSNQVNDFARSVPLVVDAVYAFAHALSYTLEECQKNTSLSCAPLDKISGEHLLEVIRKQIFQSPTGNVVNFTKEGDVIGVYEIFYHGVMYGKNIEYIRVAKWKGAMGKLYFENFKWQNEFSPLKSTCETICSANQYREESTKPRTCWPCKDCHPGSYAVNETSCHECPKGQKADVEQKICVEIVPTYFTADGKHVPLIAVVVPIVFASTGLASVIFVGGVFAKHWNTPLVKASGRELSSLLLLGILLTFFLPFVAIVRPSLTKCSWQFILGSLPFSICFVAIAVKNNRTYRIFNPNRVLTAQPSMTRPKSQILISLALIAFQLILLSALMTLDFPRDTLIYEDFKTVNHICTTSPTQMLLSHLYNVLLLIACTYYGYKTKNIPRNFNEAKYIAFAMYGVCLTMVTFGAVFALASQFSRDYGMVIEMMHSNFVAFIISLCFFVPKVYIILCKPEENTNNINVTTNQFHGRMRTPREQKNIGDFITNFEHREGIGFNEFEIERYYSFGNRSVPKKLTTSFSLKLCNSLKFRNAP